MNTLENNKDIIKKINEAFSEGNTKLVSDYLTEDVQWNIVGMPLINGKLNFIEAMKMMEAACGGCPDITVKNVIAEGDYVVVESSCDENTKTGQLNNPSVCDIYKIKDGKIQELTSYIIDTSVNGD